MQYMSYEFKYFLIFLQTQMLIKIWLGVLAFLWLVIGLWGYSTAQKAFRKYSKYNKISNLDPKFGGLVRDDFHKWNKQRILIGCFTIFPFRILIFAGLLTIGLIFPLLLTIFGQRTITLKLFQIYLNTCGRLVARILCQIDEQFADRNIRTPIVISNHVTWFDIFYFMMGNAPISFLAKAEVGKWPIVGVIANAIQCIYVKRESEEAKKQVRQFIKQRIDQVNRLKKKIFPLLIYPQGTTSNGKALLTFKNGAFQHMSSITAFCLKYECDGFDMGMDEISQIQHTVFMMSLITKLIVKKIEFTPNIGQTSQQYQERVKISMSEVIGIPCTEGGYRDKLELEKIRQKSQ